MRCRCLWLLPVLIISAPGCHGPADNLARLDVPSPALPGGWIQFRDEPGGFTLQTPEGWTTSAEFESSAIGNNGALLGGALLLVDGAAVQANDIVTFSIMRLRDQKVEALQVNDLEELAKKARQAMDKNMTDVKNERIQLAIGPAEHVWGVLSKTFPDGVTRKITSHMVVFASALRIYTVAYGYPTEKEAQYRGTADAILRTVRLILRNKGGKVTMPASARAGVSLPFLHSPAQSAPQPSQMPTAPSWNAQPPPVQYNPPAGNDPQGTPNSGTPGGGPTEGGDYGQGGGYPESNQTPPPQNPRGTPGNGLPPASGSQDPPVGGGEGASTPPSATP